MSDRLKAIGIVTLLAVGSLALWTAIPAGWLWVVRELDPASARYLVAITGCVATMAGTAVLLYRLEAVYEAMRGTRHEGGPPSWLRAVNDDGAAARRMSLLDVMLVASAVVALIALVVWWALLADNPSPSGPLQPL